MPSLYLPSMQRQLALTPPEYPIYYPLDATNLPPIQDGYYYDIGGQGLPNDIFDASALRKLARHNKYPTRKESLYDRPQQHHYAAPTRRENPFGPIGPPMLPRLRIPETTIRGRPTIPMASSIQINTMPPPVASAPRLHHQEPPKEEKASGGVALHLDYEMEHMVDFVAEVARGMYELSGRLNLADIDLSQSVRPGTTVSTSFRTFVSQILSATRLPSSTILCALNYLAARMTMLSERGFSPSSSTKLYYMLTAALMIASKFLDDNTFQNRSWSDVSHIAVAELNKHEMEWLMDIGWNLHVDTRKHAGLTSWIAKWDAYKAVKEDELSLEQLRLADTGRAHYHAPASASRHYSPQTPAFTPYPDSAYALSTRDTPVWQPWAPQSRDLSPPSANQSGPATPDWYARSGGGYGHAPSAWSAGPAPLPPLPSIRSTDQSPSYYSSYTQQYSYNSWGHAAGCGCGYCALQHDRYGMAHSYGVQPVMG